MRLSIRLIIGIGLFLIGAWAFLGNGEGSDIFGFLTYLLSLGLIYFGGMLVIVSKTSGKKVLGSILLIIGLLLITNWIPILFDF
ncbi:hypothetical protein [Thermoflavimicrobium daqui]|jgi:hypothetical protein|uniref:DUF3953 domain-containing protein n=1 Tax=Thermoflavimicrobium daqui TaxID=2137476 RepID=A0A364K3L2_9BACL|nr:hypothetical protein [Thermoflavimicrobium daqui]RAL23435.1 hypothetical protein DL897_12190 [Thermoflavimicrobium daqui]